MFRVLISLLLLTTPAYALNFEVGTFIADVSAGPGTQVVSTSGDFTPEGIVIFASHAHTNALWEYMASYGFIAWDSSYKAYAGFGDDDNDASSDAHAAWRASEMFLPGLNLTSTWYSRFGLTALGPSSFTITWNSNDEDSSSIFTYIIFEGFADWGVGWQGFVGSDTGSVTVTVSDTPDVVMTVFAGTSTSSQNPTTSITGGTVTWGFGLATDTTEQYSVAEMVHIDNTTMNNKRSYSDTNIAHFRVETSGYEAQVIFGGFDSTGWRWSWRTDASWGASDNVGMFYLWWKLPAGGFVDIGSANTPASTGTNAVTTTGEPEAVFFFSSFTASEFEDTDATMTAGVADAAGGVGSYWVGSEDGIGTSNTKSRTDTTKAFQGYVGVDSTYLYASWDSFNSTDFTLNWGATVSSLPYLYLAFGPPSGAAPGGAATRRLHYLKRWGL